MEWFVRKTCLRETWTALRRSSEPRAKALLSAALLIVSGCAPVLAQTTKGPVGQPPAAAAGAPNNPEGGVVRAQHGSVDRYLSQVLGVDGTARERLAELYLET